MSKTLKFKIGTIVRIVGATVFKDAIWVGLNGSIEVFENKKFNRLVNLISCTFLLSRKLENPTPEPTN